MATVNIKGLINLRRWPFVCRQSRGSHAWRHLATIATAPMAL